MSNHSFRGNQRNVRVVRLAAWTTASPTNAADGGSEQLEGKAAAKPIECLIEAMNFLESMDASLL